ncbi:hypothetical protein [Roseobacter sp. CCS2]|uniref:hypothetical protein n=1 Tax=Roseobacter sp. CCS2 TaxID=391593 RepID=UPI0000F404E8|nr:hypothetical protein [Roseobacter sp. CCS2]EBA13819.1 hypothetical protein RCCS2_08019 [Roseobacter sp. CCS2]
MNAQAFEMFSMTEIYRTIVWALGPTFVAAAILLTLRLRNRLSNREKDPSAGVQKTLIAKLDGGLPLDLSLIAGAGRRGQAPQTFQDTYLRPTIGLRLIMFGFPVLLYFILQSLEAVQGIHAGGVNLTAAFSAILLVLMIHNIVYFNIYELRYDDRRILHRTWFYRQIELPLSQLLSIRDDGMYFYILRADDGKTAYIPKHLIGIEDFVRTVRASIAKNEVY